MTLTCRYIKRSIGQGNILWSKISRMRIEGSKYKARSSSKVFAHLMTDEKFDSDVYLFVSTILFARYGAFFKYWFCPLREMICKWAIRYKNIHVLYDIALHSKDDYTSADDMVHYYLTGNIEQILLEDNVEMFLHRGLKSVPSKYRHLIKKDTKIYRLFVKQKINGTEIKWHNTLIP